MAVILPIVDMRPGIGPARDQGSRPTCLAFATSDGHAAVRGAWVPLSPEFLFFHTQRRAGLPPTRGARLPVMLDALLKDGQPEESSWPYLATDPDPANWSPPPAVGAIHRHRSTLVSATVDQIIAEVSIGNPVIVVSQLSVSFYFPTTGGVVKPGADEVPDPARRHAVLAVGHGTVDGERAVLARNSWGAGWGSAGYAWVTETFLTPRIISVAKLC